MYSEFLLHKVNAITEL